MGLVKLEDWHPMLIIVLLALGLLLLEGYLCLLLIFHLPPIIFIPLIPATTLVLYLYQEALRKYYGERKFKKLIVLAFSLVLIFITPISIYAITRPNWSFKVTTDKAIYKLGENVTITAMLTNNAYLTQSLGDLCLVGLEFEVRNASQDLIARNYVNLIDMKISAAPGDSIKITFVWFASSGIGNYSASAEVSRFYWSPYHFTDQVTITITP